eukprot:CAMPEP_0202690072 /NCGR_PEP_ID=MMETSP1385-20130828/5194_1 /ASSEMBLY_ACC=CAM_ASM_000861 /TAXON_ID=933848 /ORGANISM="Elphidium margaritaceum" /LENGTH=198 /DNA_ID=CAMNT_0049345301 /DNA_START=641 /DNA_END=1237 /DNA_ORIENTATION=-
MAKATVASHHKIATGAVDQGIPQTGQEGDFLRPRCNDDQANQGGKSGYKGQAAVPFHHAQQAAVTRHHSGCHHLSRGYTLHQFANRLHEDVEEDTAVREIDGARKHQKADLAWRGPHDTERLVIIARIKRVDRLSGEKDNGADQVGDPVDGDVDRCDDVEQNRFGLRRVSGAFTSGNPVFLHEHQVHDSLAAPIKHET